MLVVLEIRSQEYRTREAREARTRGEARLMGESDSCPPVGVAEANPVRPPTWARWNEQIGPPLCAHLHVELENNHSAYVTSTYHCRECGEAIVRTYKSPTFSGMPYDRVIHYQDTSRASPLRSECFDRSVRQEAIAPTPRDFTSIVLLPAMIPWTHGLPHSTRSPGTHLCLRKTRETRCCAHRPGV
jgi:hypothetical protein